MRRAILWWLCVVVTFVSLNVNCMAQSLYDLSAKSIDGESTKLSEYRGKVLLIVNVASQCGYTPQYAGLQKLYATYHDRGLEVLGFPSNDFGQQEPGPESEIKHFCSSKFGVSFPLFAKTKVTGPEKDPVYSFLTKSTGGAEVGWNFEKFLVNRQGLVIGRFPSGVRPEDSRLVTEIERALASL
jgi:glutathione peroxidase